jgi:hypothetical protein
LSAPYAGGFFSAGLSTFVDDGTGVTVGCDGLSELWDGCADVGEEQVGVGVSTVGLFSPFVGEVVDQFVEAVVG